MDVTPKTKFFGFKRKAQSFQQTSSSENYSVSKREVNDLRTLPISPDVICTSPIAAVSRISRVSNSQVDPTSPQFVVGWNDSAEKNDIDMNSPIRSVPVLRKIRRCPDNLSFKPLKMNAKDDGEGAILQCIDWAKNLFESTSIEKEVAPVEKIVTGLKGETKNIDIAIDDSVDEIMILCSQAVEESIPSSKFSSVLLPKLNTCEMHLRTPEKNDRLIKRLKLDSAPINASTDIVKNDKKSQHINLNNNNIDQNSNLNFSSPAKILTNKSCSNYDVKLSDSGTNLGLVPESSVSISDRNETHLEDDDDDLFGSFDFRMLDRIQNSFNKSTSKKLLTNSNSIAVRSSKLNANPNFSKPVIKYSREQIEQRRLEAKKRLMFNRKHKSV